MRLLLFGGGVGGEASSIREGSGVRLLLFGRGQGEAKKGVHHHGELLLKIKSNISELFTLNYHSSQIMPVLARVEFPSTP